MRQIESIERTWEWQIDSSPRHRNLAKRCKVHPDILVPRAPENRVLGMQARLTWIGWWLGRGLEFRMLSDTLKMEVPRRVSTWISNNWSVPLLLVRWVWRETRQSSNPWLVLTPLRDVFHLLISRRNSLKKILWLPWRRTLNIRLVRVSRKWGCQNNKFHKVLIS